MRKTKFLTTVIGLLGLSAAVAGSHDFSPSKILPIYEQECAACHIAYPPALLPADSWQRILNGLEQHYGTDASLDTQQVQDIMAWLRRQAGTDRKRRIAPLEDRISRSKWFNREHWGMGPQVWKHASVRSPAQCEACHTHAAQGRFDEDDVRVPAGISKRFR